jgi:hypothetical protein
MPAVGDPDARHRICSYHRGVANVGIASVVLVSMAALLALVLRVSPGQYDGRTRALVGLVPGLIGASVVAALTIDFVPDWFEALAMPWVVAAVTIGMILLIIRNLAEH